MGLEGGEVVAEQVEAPVFDVFFGRVGQAAAVDRHLRAPGGEHTGDGAPHAAGSADHHGGANLVHWFPFRLGSSLEMMYSATDCAAWPVSASP